MPTSPLDLVDGLAAALFEEPGYGHRGEQPAAAPPHSVLVVLTGLALAATIVALTTVVVLGLDAFLHLDLQFDRDPWRPRE